MPDFKINLVFLCSGWVATRIESEKPFDVIVVGAGAAGVGIGIALKRVGVVQFQLVCTLKT